MAGAAAVGLAVAAGAVATAGPWDSGQRTAERDRAAAARRTGGAHHLGAPPAPAPAPSARGVLAALSAPANAPADTALDQVLGPLLAAPGLGPQPAAAVYDTATGKQLYGQRADTAMTPASTVKIATAVAALSALGPDHRIPTTVVAPATGNLLTLVGGGDPTLGKDGLRALADATARALRTRGFTDAALTYDLSRYRGPELHPIGPNENIAPVVALMTDEGRTDGSDSGPAPRTGDPAGDTARTFASLLRERGITLTGAPGPGKAPQGATELARTLSAPLSDLVERMLTNSDNDLAEALARQTATAAGIPADFDGAAKAVADRLAALGLPQTAGARFADGSGLSRDDRVSAQLLTLLLARAADPAHPELRPVLTGLPVAGFTGTLRGRYGAASSGTGLVRAKTGTLSGVNTLAGTVVDADGHLLTFAFLAADTPGPDPAQHALDKLAEQLARCGCHTARPAS
ncbi:D-alanyl-D-alanine carboxypeptidase/D-alanyl-D-alanine-endopeptidase [Streptomyces sp. BPTC-684]|uniref:D-alanyl-D-alanine carboxypeptidase/D-alanyl-D-alanine endopeptidase n=1 Tax=Streptomyces sp. BPTC-684 TaxID=3043734 RepID=UPI0024B15E9E|nr:D-alanyl-D-alanine carboxypeptidase/D-alanyl-D-alanine-endopeptidase [Streptomyces sp. BPTC-684]WHM41290.1 D-alanyl-D-alanine carboxypeptidase/D-alanyl-D-alanine-endopeptidase [Streptomyces sp. BPTC-684]